MRGTIILVCAVVSLFGSSRVVAQAQASGPFSLAVASFQRGLYHDALSYFRQAQKVNPQHGEAHHGVALCLYLTKRHRESLPHFVSAENCANPQAQFFVNHAVCMEHLSRTAEAIVLLGRAISVDPKFTNAWFNLGKFNLRQGKHEEALKSLTMTLQLEPKHKGAHYELGNLYFGRKDYPLAESWARKAVALDSENPAPLYLLARSLLRLERRAEGQSLARKALNLRKEVDRKSRLQMKVNSTLTLAFEELRKKNIAAAIEYFKQVLRIDPRNPQAYSTLNGLADAFEKAGQPKTAASIRSLLK